MSERPGRRADLTLSNTDIEAVGQQLIEDNIVSVSRQMIDKEATVPKANGEVNGHNDMEVDRDAEL